MLEEIESARELAASPQCTARADSVSHWGVQQQLDHLLLTDQAILDGLEGYLSGNAPPGPEGRPSLMGHFVLRTGFIPRGKGRAPERVLPGARSPEEITAEFGTLLEGYRKLGESLGEIQAGGATQRHPLLGVFNGAQWLRFAHLHHRHHNKIIADILRAA
jgi:hypothetical protein